MSEVNQPQVLKDLYYPVGSAQPSCIRFLQTNSTTFEIKPQIINMLPKFTGNEDAYIFIRKFEKVCDTMRIHQMSDDAIKLRLINFASRTVLRNDYIVYPTTRSQHGMDL